MIELNGSNKHYNSIGSTSDLYDYFHSLITILSLYLDDRCRLSKKEHQVLAHCCVYNAKGGDLNNLSELANYFIERKILNDKGQLSNYKVDISAKKWARTGYNQFTPIRPLMEEPNDYAMLIEFNGEVEQEFSDNAV